MQQNSIVAELQHHSATNVSARRFYLVVGGDVLEVAGVSDLSMGSVTVHLNEFVGCGNEAFIFHCDGDCRVGALGTVVEPQRVSSRHVNRGYAVRLHFNSVADDTTLLLIMAMRSHLDAFFNGDGMHINAA